MTLLCSVNCHVVPIAVITHDDETWKLYHVRGLHVCQSKHSAVMYILYNFVVVDVCNYSK